MRNFISTIIAVAVVGSMAFAGDLEWSGAYRIEGNDFQNLALKTGTKKSKSYGVHQLILRPKIVAVDGLYINAQLNSAAIPIPLNFTLRLSTPVSPDWLPTSKPILALSIWREK